MRFSTIKHIVLSLMTLTAMSVAQNAPAKPAPTAANSTPSQVAPAAPVQTAPAAPVQAAPAAQAALAPVMVPSRVDIATAPRGTSSLEEMIQAKLDSMNKAVPTMGPRNADSLSKVQADSVRKLIQEGKYVKRARYDKKNFDHWNIDTVLQKNMKNQLVGVWRTPIVAHGHAFRDAELRFGMNDTLVGITRTYSDSGRYQMTGEYMFKARYRFDSERSMATREVFADRKVVRWDFVSLELTKDSLVYGLNKLEFRDLNDNWLNALQGFENVPPELYIRDEKASEELKKMPVAEAPKGPAVSSKKKK
ncbi:MAG: hypothetical protein HUK20_09435 [Fibrobacter sp.]|nr:hypothetical protein [Fibrobacter sp.]